MAVVGAIAAVVGAAYSIYSGETARTEKRWAAGDQERADLKANDERVRRQEERNKQTQADTRARAAATGVSSTTGSVGNFLLAQKKESTRQLDWMRTAGTESAALQRKTGIAQGDYMAQQGMAAGISQFGQAAKSFSQTDWYRSNYG